MIGNTVKFKDYCDETYTGKVVDMFSDKFDDVKWLVIMILATSSFHLQR